jgi:hypothetical protein
MTPPGLPAICDGCNLPNSTNHALNCPFGGLVTLRHNDIREELGAIATEVFQPSAVTIEPILASTPASTIISPGQHIHNTTTTLTVDPPSATANQVPTANNTQERSDIAIHSLFECGTNAALIDIIRIANQDSSSYRSQDPEKVLQQQETAKRQKYQDICETCQESFHPFIASADGMLAPEATKILQHLAHITANNKTQKPYSAIVKHLRLRIAITLVKAAHHCLRASRKKCHHTPSSNTPNQPSEPSPEYRMLNG